MALEKSILKESIKKKGYWNFTDLYTFCFEWLKDENYDIKENEYTEKISDFGKEIILKWTAERDITDYFRYKIVLKWHILGMKDAQIERDGKKEATNKGEVKIAVEAFLVKDYEDRWENKPFWKFLRGIYDKYIIRTTIDEYGSKLKEEALEFINQVKSFLELEGK